MQDGRRRSFHGVGFGLGVAAVLGVMLIAASGSVAATVSSRTALLDSAAGTGGAGGSASSAGYVWASLAEKTAPSDRYGSGFAYDSAAREVVLFGGGYTPGSGGVIPFGDTWVFHNGSWHNLTSSLPLAPSARVDAALVYDAADGYLVLFGGLGGVNGLYVLNDTWKFQNDRWTNITTAFAPSARSDASITYDSTLQEVVLFGGCTTTSCSVAAHDLWSFHHGKWAHVKTTGKVPPGRGDAAFAYNAATGSILLFGGWTTAVRYSDTWQFANGTWTKLALSAHPSPRLAAAMAYSPSLGGIVLFGGKYLGHFYQDTWEFLGGKWNNVTAKLPGAPSSRAYEMMTYDPATGSVVMFGGQTTFPGTLDDTWVFTSL